MLITTGRKQTLTVSKGSEIELSSNESKTIHYSATLQENLPKSKRKHLSILHLHPLTKQSYIPPLVTTTVQSLIRPVPPQDPFPDVGFEEGEVVDALYKGGWWSGYVVKVLGRGRFLVYLSFEPDVVEVDRKELRHHLVWENNEWFRSDKKELVESEFGAGKSVEVRTEVEEFGDVWAPAIAIKEIEVDDEDSDIEEEEGSLLVKYKCLSAEDDDECTKMSLPYSRIRPEPVLDVGLRSYQLLEKVEVLNECGWCRGVVTQVLSGDRYTVRLGKNKQCCKFSYAKLRPLVEWKDGAWLTEEKVVDDTDEESPLAAEEPAASTRMRVTVQTALRDINTSRAGRNLRITRSTSGASRNPPPASSSNGGNVAGAETGTDAVMNENIPVTSQPEIAVASSVVVGVAMTNRKSSTNDSVAEKAPEETNKRESVNKRKRGRQFKVVSTNLKRKTGVSTTELPDMADDGTPLASCLHGQSASQTPFPLLNAIVEKHVVETPQVKDSTMVLPFAKKSPLWKVIESMEAFRAVPQRPHFSPLVDCEEESREGDAIGAMVTFNGLIEKVNKLQVNDAVSVMNRIDECFLKLEKHGFSVTAPRSRIVELLAVKERQTWAGEELKGLKREIAEKDNKRRKCEEDFIEVSMKIAELMRQQVVLKEGKVAMEKEIAVMHLRAEALDEKVQNVEEEFRGIVAAPWN